MFAPNMIKTLFLAALAQAIRKRSPSGKSITYYDLQNVLLGLEELVNDEPLDEKTREEPGDKQG